MKIYFKLTYLFIFIFSIFILASCETKEIEDVIAFSGEGGDMLPIEAGIFKVRARFKTGEREEQTIIVNYGLSSDYYSMYYELLNSLDEYSDYDQQIKLEVKRSVGVVKGGIKVLYTEINTLRHFLSKDFRIENNALVDTLTLSDFNIGDREFEEGDYRCVSYWYELTPVNDEYIKLLRPFPESGEISRPFSPYGPYPYIKTYSAKIGVDRSGDELELSKYDRTR